MGEISSGCLDGTLIFVGVVDIVVNAVDGRLLMKI